MYGMLAFLHALILTICASFALRHFAGSKSHKILAGYLLIWFNLVITGYSLSLFSKLDNVALYLIVSCLLAVGGGGAIDSRLKKSSTKAYSVPALSRTNTPWDFSPLLILSLSAFIVAAVGSALIALFYYPNNPDSIAYRFARVFLYLGQGNLMHPAHNDPRVSYYPLNGALAYLYCAIYRLDGRWFNFFGYASWVIGSLGVYTLSRDMGGSKNGSFCASYLWALSPIVLVLATSTNDEVIAATPVLLGVIFLHRWWHTGKLIDAVFGGIGGGLGVGTKLHVAFFWPVLAIAVITILVYLYQRGALGSFFRKRFGHIMVVGCLMSVLVLPFSIVNFVESRHPILPPEFSSQVLNKPFSAKVALINLSLFSAQLFLSPLPELVISLDTGLKSRIYDRFNEFFNTHIFFWVTKNDHYSTEPYYYFRGVASPFGWWIIEETEWLGFSPFLALFGILWLWPRRKERGGALALWLLTGFFAWHLYKSAATKYIEAASTYYSYPFTICAAGVAIFWDRRDSAKRYLSLSLTCLFAFVIITHALFALNILVCNLRRNLPSLITAQCSPETIQALPLPSAVKTFLALAAQVHTRLPMPIAALESLRSAKKIHLVYTRWEFPSFQFMSRNPAARFTSSGEMAREEGSLNIFLYAARSEFAHIPIQITGGRQKERLTALGGIYAELGTEYIFGKGNNLHNTYPGSSGFIVIHPTLQYDKEGAKVLGVTFSPAVMGTDEADCFEYRLSQTFSDGRVAPVTKWFSQAQLDRPVTLPMAASDGYLKVQVRSADDRGTIFEASLPLKKGDEINPPNIDPSPPPPAPSAKITSGPLQSTPAAPCRIADLIDDASPLGVHVEGMREPEGPYSQWDLPRVRWAKRPEVRIQLDNPPENAISSAVLSLTFRLQTRPAADMLVKFNGKTLKAYSLKAAEKWYSDTLTLAPKPGANVLELSFGPSGEPRPADSLYMLFKTFSLKGE